MRMDYLRLGQAIADEKSDHDRRYTHVPDFNLMDGLCQSKHVRKPDIREGCAFIEPMRGSRNGWWR